MKINEKWMSHEINAIGLPVFVWLKRFCFYQNTIIESKSYFAYDEHRILNGNPVVASNRVSEYPSQSICSDDMVYR